MANLKKLMTLLSNEGLMEKRAEIIYEWTHGRTTSAKELTEAEIAGMCVVLQKDSFELLDKKRKRLIAAIFGVHKRMNRETNINYVKAVACRAAKVDNFNRIPAQRLDSLYNAFLKMEKDLDFTGKMLDGYLNEQMCYN